MTGTRLSRRATEWRWTLASVLAAALGLALAAHADPDALDGADTGALLAAGGIVLAGLARDVHDLVRRLRALRRADRATGAPPPGEVPDRRRILRAATPVLVVALSALGPFAVDGGEAIVAGAIVGLVGQSAITAASNRLVRRRERADGRRYYELDDTGRVLWLPAAGPFGDESLSR